MSISWRIIYRHLLEESEFVHEKRTNINIKKVGIIDLDKRRKRDFDRVIRINRINTIINVFIALSVGLLVLVICAFIPSTSLSGVKSSFASNFLASFNLTVFIVTACGCVLVLLIAICAKVWFVKRYRKFIV